MPRNIIFKVLMCIIAALPVTAQIPGIEVYARGGVSMPVTPDAFVENWNENYTWSAGLRVPIKNTVKAGLGFSYHSFLFDLDAARTGPLSPALVIALRGSRASVAHIDLHFAWWTEIIQNVVVPQLTAGIGMTRIDAPGALEAAGQTDSGSTPTEDSIESNSVSNMPSLHVGLELKFRILPMLQLGTGARFSGSPGEDRISTYTSYTIGLHYELP